MHDYIIKNDVCPKCKAKRTNMNDGCRESYISDNYCVWLCDDCGMKLRTFMELKRDILYELFICNDFLKCTLCDNDSEHEATKWGNILPLCKECSDN